MRRTTNRNRKQPAQSELSGEGLAQLIAKFGMPLLKQLGLAALSKGAEKVGEAVGDKVGSAVGRKIRGQGPGITQAGDSQLVFQGLEGQTMAVTGKRPKRLSGKGSVRAGNQDDDCCVTKKK